MTRYRCVDTQKADGFPVTRVCAVMGVSTSAYAWASHDGPSPAELREQRVLKVIEEIHGEHPDYGSPRSWPNGASRPTTRWSSG